MVVPLRRRITGLTSEQDTAVGGLPLLLSALLDFLPRSSLLLWRRELPTWMRLRCITVQPTVLLSCGHSTATGSGRCLSAASIPVCYLDSWSKMNKIGLISATVSQMYVLAIPHDKVLLTISISFQKRSSLFRKNHPLGHPTPTTIWDLNQFPSLMILVWTTKREKSSRKTHQMMGHLATTRTMKNPSSFLIPNLGHHTAADAAIPRKETRRRRIVVGLRGGGEVGAKIWTQKMIRVPLPPARLAVLMSLTCQPFQQERRSRARRTTLIQVSRKKAISKMTG